MNEISIWRQQRHLSIKSSRSRITVLFFCVANVGFTMIDEMFSYFLLDHLMSTGLSGSTAGLILLISELFNVFVGPLSSLLMSVFPLHRFGMHRSWLLITSLPLAVSFVFLWIPFGSEYSRSIIDLSVLLVFNWFYGHSLCIYESIMPLMYSDPSVLQSINTGRLFCGSIGGLFITSFIALVSSNSDFSILYTSSFIPASFLLVGVLGWIVSVSEKNSAKSSSISLNHLSQSDDTLATDVNTIKGQSSKRQIWFTSSHKLFRSRRFLSLLINHFLLWMIRIFMHSSFPAFARIFKTESSSVLIVFSTLGTSITQIIMCLNPKRLVPELVIRISLFLLFISSATFSFGFHYVGCIDRFHLPVQFSYFVAFISGCAIGGLFSSFEIMVPETILFAEKRLEFPKTIISDSLTQNNNHNEEDLTAWENIIYGWVDSIRELSLAISFLLVGAILEHVPSLVAINSDEKCNSWIFTGEEITTGLIPIVLGLCLMASNYYFPDIIFRDK